MWSYIVFSIWFQKIDDPPSILQMQLGNLPVLFALFVHAGDFVQQINGNVWRLPMLHVNVTTDEEPRRTKFLIESKAEGLKIAKKYSGWNFQGMEKESEKTDGDEKTKVRNGSTKDTWDGTQNSELLANDSVFSCWRWNFVFFHVFCWLNFRKLHVWFHACCVRPGHLLVAGVTEHGPPRFPEARCRNEARWKNISNA